MGKTSQFIPCLEDVSLLHSPWLVPRATLMVLCINADKQVTHFFWLWRSQSLLGFFQSSLARRHFWSSVSLAQGSGTSEGSDFQAGELN